MQFLQIPSSLKLSDLADRVGDRNVDQVLNLNSLSRTPLVGSEFESKSKDIISNFGDISNPDKATSFRQRKISMLNTLTSDSDVFEYAALMDDDDWKLFQTLGTFRQMLRIPSSIILPDATDILGNGQSISKVIYNKTMDCLYTAPYQVNPAIFNEYSIIKPSALLDRISEYGPSATKTNPFQWFNLPFGKITLYSSMSGDSIDFPVYPESVDDGRTANYTTMPNMLYQYEPWQVYEGSGPRSNVYEFDMHRDMWSGDHTDGKCNELIRFCQANCYPEYDGSLVNTSIVSLLVNGDCLIRGVITEVSDTWDGPIGIDGYYLHCVLKLAITEVSESALNYTSVRNKSLIG